MLNMNSLIKMDLLNSIVQFYLEMQQKIQLNYLKQIILEIQLSYLNQVNYT